MPHSVETADVKAALMAVISATEGTPTGATLCRRLLRTAFAVVLDEQEEPLLPPAAKDAARILLDMATNLTMAAEHADFLAEHVSARAGRRR